MQIISRISLIIFLKEPVLGKVKSRLAKSIGKKHALDAYIRLLAKSIFNVSNFMQKCQNVNALYLYYHSDKNLKLTANETPNSLKKLIRRHFPLKQYIHIRKQCDGDLGIKLKTAFAELSAQGAEKIIVIGSDCPYIEPKILLAATQKLERADLVIGKAADGGYYLLGVNNFYPQLFEQIRWSSTFTAEDTLTQAHKLKLKIAQLPILKDVDTKDDWLAALRDLKDL